MPRKSPFKHHRFPREIILCAVRWYLRFPPSYQDVVDLVAERGINVDRSTVYRWVIKFGPELAKRQQHIQREPSHRVGRVEGLRDRDEGHACRVKPLDHLGKIHQ